VATAVSSAKRKTEDAPADSISPTPRAAATRELAFSEFNL
jgi:hypothetical protein